MLLLHHDEVEESVLNGVRVFVRNNEGLSGIGIFGRDLARNGPFHTTQVFRTIKPNAHVDVKRLATLALVSKNIVVDFSQYFITVEDVFIQQGFPTCYPDT